MQIFFTLLSNLLLKFEQSVMMTQNMDVVLSVLTFVPMGLALLLESPFAGILSAKLDKWRAKKNEAKLKQMEESGIVSDATLEAMQHRHARQALQRVTGKVMAAQAFQPTSKVAMGMQVPQLMMPQAVPQEVPLQAPKQCPSPLRVYNSEAVEPPPTSPRSPASPDAPAGGGGGVELSPRLGPKLDLQPLSSKVGEATERGELIGALGVNQTSKERPPSFRVSSNQLYDSAVSKRDSVSSRRALASMKRTGNGEWLGLMPEETANPPAAAPAPAEGLLGGVLHGAEEALHKVDEMAHRTRDAAVVKEQEIAQHVGEMLQHTIELQSTASLAS